MTMNTKCGSCPICGRDRKDPPNGNRHYPFCSARCQLVDLGKWLNEEYSIPLAEGTSADGEAE